MISLSRNILFVCMVFFCLLLAYVTAKYLSFESDINFLLVKGDLIFDSIWRPTFYVHVISGIFIIAIAPIQFIPYIRKKSIRLHKFLGKIYAYGILLLAGPTGIIMAFYAEGGTSSTIAFLIMGCLWIFTTFLAVQAIVKKDIIGHQKWMYRSFALSTAAVTLRILVPMMSITHWFDEQFIIVSTAWLSWMINLGIAELIILQKFHLKNKII